MQSELIKALKQRIDELQRENSTLNNTIENLTAEIDNLQERVLDLEACS